MTVFKLEFEVRDNEIDIQGVVNNANYFNYFAHTRHKFLREQGVNFSEFAEQKQFLFLVSAKIDFKKSLLPDDAFYVTCILVPEGKVRFACVQEIRRVADDALIATAHNVCVCLDGNNRNRPYIPEVIKNNFALVEV